eukprot:6105108-Prymnesium_polylepis.1
MRIFAFRRTNVPNGRYLPASHADHVSSLSRPLALSRLSTVEHGGHGPNDGSEERLGTCTRAERAAPARPRVALPKRVA